MARLGHLERLDAISEISSVDAGEPQSEINQELQWVENLPGASDPGKSISISAQIDLKNSILSPIVRLKVNKLVDRHEEAFVMSDGKIGSFRGQTVHRIELQPGVTPTRQKAYRTPHALKPEIERQLEEMLAQYIIRPSASAFAAPIVLVTN